MTRSTYASPAYATLMRHVRAEEWPRLERAAGMRLVHPGDVVFFGPDHETLGAYAAAVHAAGVDVERLTAAHARRRFPALAFPDDAVVLHDRTGGVIAAAETMRALQRLVTALGGSVLEETRVVEIDGGGETLRIVSDRGVLHADRAVVATGAWLPDLVPAARRALTVVAQTVAYFRLGVPPRSLPLWIHFGGASSGIIYALPEMGREALKVGLHVTKGAGTDPDTAATPSPDELRALQASVEEILAAPVRECLGGERCLYTMTATEDFVIDHWPGDRRVAFASACSGHGFKFAPLTGRLLAELVVHGHADLPGGASAASLFALRGEARR